MSAIAKPVRLERIAPRQRNCMTPAVVEDDPGLVLVDATWGTIQPMTVAPGVRTIGELELIEHLQAGRQLIDTRREVFVAEGTIPGAVPIDHTEIAEHLDAIDADQPVALFCNGPQCAATPDAVRRLLAAGRPPELILYYRGGIHDWITLGLPVERGRSAAASVGRPTDETCH